MDELVIVLITQISPAGGQVNLGIVSIYRSEELDVSIYLLFHLYTSLLFLRRNSVCQRHPDICLDNFV